jgi:hypothetical protein
MDPKVQKDAMIMLIQARFGVTPTDEQLAKIQALAKDRSLSNEQVIQLSEKIVKNL